MIESSHFRYLSRMLSPCTSLFSAPNRRPGRIPWCSPRLLAAWYSRNAYSNRNPPALRISAVHVFGTLLDARSEIGRSPSQQPGEVTRSASCSLATSRVLREEPGNNPPIFTCSFLSRTTFPTCYTVVPLSELFSQLISKFTFSSMAE